MRFWELSESKLIRTAKAKAKAALQPKSEEDGDTTVAGPVQVGKPLNKKQKKECDKLVSTMDSLVLRLTKGLATAEQEEYKNEVPPSTVPKVKVSLASLVEARATVDLLLRDDWKGNAQPETDRVKTALDGCSAMANRLDIMIENADVVMDEDRAQQ